MNREEDMCTCSFYCIHDEDDNLIMQTRDGWFAFWQRKEGDYLVYKFDPGEEVYSYQGIKLNNLAECAEYAYEHENRYQLVEY